MTISAQDYDNAKRVKAVRVTKRTGPKVIPICGEKDPRGPDNNITVYIDYDGSLRIRVWKTDRCYKFDYIYETNGFIEVVAK